MINLPFFQDPVPGEPDDAPITKTYTAADARRDELDHYFARAQMYFAIAASLLTALFFLRALVRKD